MALRTWDPFRELEAIRRHVERVLEEHDTWPRGRAWTAFLPGLGARSYPLINIGEDQENVYVEALAPGLDPGALEISVVHDTLRIAGEKAALDESIKPEAYHRSERSAGRFVRSVSLPTRVNSDKVSAEYRNGLLLVTLPKAEEAKPRHIAVDVK